jgi:hypothetical protein
MGGKIGPGTIAKLAQKEETDEELEEQHKEDLNLPSDSEFQSQALIKKNRISAEWNLNQNQKMV